MAGLAFSLAGDVFLMFPGFFIPGLVSFLVAHLLLHRAVQARACRGSRARAALLQRWARRAMYAFLFPHLGPVLKVAVAAYVVVIALMAAQAIGRATVLRDARPSASRSAPCSSC